MRKLATIILLLAISQIGHAQEPESTNWLTKLELAQAQAAKEGKYILLNFSGSDWCMNCKRLHKSLFITTEFTEFAKENLVLLNLDFPARKKNRLPKEEQEYNDALAEKYNKSGAFPTVLILDSKGNIVGQLEYPQLDPKAYIESIKKLITK